MGMKINDCWWVNVFTGPNALGNQTAVVLLGSIDDTDRLHTMAKHINLPATTFLSKHKDGYHIRWFAADAEIGLCGHGTVGATWVLSQFGLNDIPFYYNGGMLLGRMESGMVALNATAILATPSEVPEHVQRGFCGKVLSYHTSMDKQLVVLESEDAVRSMHPNWEALRTSDTFGYVITAQGVDYDCVSRVILPYVSFLEDQATGSAHMMLGPYWSQRLGKAEIQAYQASRRGGQMRVRVQDNQVTLLASCNAFANGVVH